MPTPTQTSKQLDRIENAIIGNGHEGLLARTARIEEKLVAAAEDRQEIKEKTNEALDRTSETLSETTKTLNEITNNFVKLEAIVKTHIGTDHLSVLMRKKQFWALIIFGFVVLHLLSTYVPNIWDWLVVIVGLPHLVIPLN